MKFALLTAVSIFAFTPLGMADTIQVPADYSTIQEAIDNATAGDMVLVAPGTYVENILFHGKAIHLKSSHGAEATIIDGRDYTSGSYRGVVAFDNNEGRDSILEGFGLTNGDGAYNYSTKNYCGGGIYCGESTSPTIRDNIVALNMADYGAGIYCGKYSAPLITDSVIAINGNYVESVQGGGIYCDMSSEAHISNNDIYSNTVTDDGGGLYLTGTNTTLKYNKISRNKGEFGGGIFMTAVDCSTLLYNQITENWTTDRFYGSGGGVYCQFDCSPMLKYNIIVDNTADINGGGFYCRLDCAPMLIGNTFIGNTCGAAMKSGGGIYCDGSSPQIIGNLLTRNRAHTGSGIALLDCNDTVLINNSIVKNKGSYFNPLGGGLYSYDSDVTIENTIFWGNTASTGAEIWLGGTSSLMIDYSNVRNIQSTVFVSSFSIFEQGEYMVEGVPEFVDLSADDFHLTFDSPCRNAGLTMGGDIQYDFEGDPRIADGTIDIGADEFHTHLYCTGDTIPGGFVDLKFIGYPSIPATLFVGGGLLDPPVQTAYGLWYLHPPIIPFTLGPIPGNGVHIIHTTIPIDFPAPVSIPIQGFILGSLTNQYSLEVETP